MVAVASRIRLEDRECPLSTTVEHVGEWWTLLILHDAFDGYSRFDQFQESLGISSSMLTTRLKTLVEDGLLERRPYQTNPVRHEYVLTELGHSLRPVIVALAALGQLPPRAGGAQHDPRRRAQRTEVEPSSSTPDRPPTRQQRHLRLHGRPRSQRRHAQPLRDTTGGSTEGA